VEDNQTLVNHTSTTPRPHFPVPSIPAATYCDLPVRPDSALAPGKNQDFTALRPDPHGASLNPDSNLDDDKEENVEPFDNHPAFQTPPCHENDVLYENCDDVSKSIYRTFCYPQKTPKTT